MNTSYQLDYHRKYHLAICRPIGSLTEELLDKVLYFTLGMETGAPDQFNRLVDLASVTQFPLQSAAIHRYADLRRESFEHLPPCRVAFVAHSPDAKDVAGLYKALMTGSKASVNIFGDAKSAADWLGVPENLVAPQPAGHA